MLEDLLELHDFFEKNNFFEKIKINSKIKKDEQRCFLNLIWDNKKIKDFLLSEPNSEEIDIFDGFYNKYCKPFFNSSNNELNGNKKLFTASYLGFRIRQADIRNKINLDGFYSKLLSDNEVLQEIQTFFIQNINLILSKFEDHFKENEGIATIYILIKNNEEPIQELTFLYEQLFEDYCLKKSFVSQDQSYSKKTCILCGAKNTEIGMPKFLNNLNKDKFSLKHNTKKIKENVCTCGVCAGKINSIGGFLKDIASNNTGNMGFIIPLDSSTKLNLINEKNELKNIFNPENEELLNNTVPFKLFEIIKAGKDIAIKIEYIDPFIFEKNKKIYENLINLCPWQKNMTKEKEKERTLYLNIAHKIKYEGRKDLLSLNLIYEIYQNNSPKNFFDFEKKHEALKALTAEYKGGYKMKIEEIEKDKERWWIAFNNDKITSKLIENEETLAYYTGQIIRYLSYKKKTNNNKYTAEIDFLNTIKSYNLLSEEIQKMFFKRKHALYKNNKRVNIIFSEFWALLAEYADKPFDKKLIPIVFAGFFSDNIFFRKKINENEEE